MTRRSGSVAYAHTGRGGPPREASTPPTDLPIFWLWALTEYVWATGDRALLDEPIPFDPPAAGAATPRQRVALAHRYLVERIGTGPHGLVRVGSGDWADPISAMVADRRAFHEHGESGFNTAFAVHVLPRAAELVAHDDPALAAELRATADGCAGRWRRRGTARGSFVASTGGVDRWGIGTCSSTVRSGA